MFNPIDFIYTHWREGTIGLAILAAVIVAALAVGIYKECGK